MNTSVLDLSSLRAKKARLAAHIGKQGFLLLEIISALLLVVAIGLLIAGSDSLGFLLLALGLLGVELSIWYKRDLEALPPNNDNVTNRIAGNVLAKLEPKQTVTVPVLWESTANVWQSIFITNHLYINPDHIKNALGISPPDIKEVLNLSRELADKDGRKSIEAGHITGAIIILTPGLKTLLSEMNLTRPDIVAVVAWLDRAQTALGADKPYFGGVGRDWANGYTPQLNHYGNNVSLGIEQSGSYFSHLTGSIGVQNMKNAFSEGSSAIAIIGDDGIGKTSHVYALAQLLLAERNDRNLEHRQIIELGASAIISSAPEQGEIERVVLGLMREASRAGHIILFLDDAQLFFNTGPGAFDITQILTPIIEAHGIQIVLAMSPHDFEQLKATHSKFASLLTPVVLTEPDEENSMRVVEDATMNLEGHHHVVITYEAIREAYRLSNRYDQTLANPGKTIQLLTEALAHQTNGLVGVTEVQATIEQTKGVKVSTATATEASDLLNLESKIHDRMINQTFAVKVVSDALRRARAGVTNPNRPIGSFLFLGPTGVGKTELAKALAATYFGSETNMIRLDMSEYQQADSIDRLLSNGSQQTKSLILSVREQPSSVVLLDEIEKAYSGVLNLLLQLLDEGQLTDSDGKATSFKDCIVIATSNAGAQTIRQEIEKGQSPENFQPKLIEELINSGQFKPELINRFDEVVVFRPLSQTELSQVVDVMMRDVNKTLQNQNITVNLTPAATDKIVRTGYDPLFGARPMRHVLQRAVEDTIAQKILKNEIKPGDSVTLDVNDLSI